MKLYAAYLIRTSEIIWSNKNLNDFGYFERNTISQYMNFFSKTVADRIEKGSKHIVEDKGYKINSYHNNEGFICIIITDAEYPNRVTYTIINNMLEVTDLKELDIIFQKYQNVNEADKLMKLQTDMEETKVIMHHNIDSVLKRGEKIDDLIKKTDELTDASKMFLKKSKKLNSCCVIS